MMKCAWMILMTSAQTIFLVISATGNKSCYEEDWQISLSRPGWTKCSTERYLNGLWREDDADFSGPDGIDKIKRGRCCLPPKEYKNDTHVCLKVHWKASLSRNNQWATCPEGYFLQGVSRSSGTSLNDIEQALCCRPRNFQNTNMNCYIEGARESLDKRGWSKCWDDSYYMAGLYRGGCDNLYCVEMIKCCKMTPPCAHVGTSSAGLSDDCYTKPVGVSDRSKIPDVQMTASTQYDTVYQAAYGRLNGNRGDGWCAERSAGNDDWLQVDLGTTIFVCGVATQGDVSGNEWVTDFKLSYSSDGNDWTPYKDANNTEVEFQRQGNSSTVDQHKLPVVVSARYVRFHPTKRHEWNCMRVEVYGNAGLLNDCYTKPVGVSDRSKIPDVQMRASTQYGINFQAAYGRLNGNRGGGWCAEKSARNDDWLQVDLGTTILFCGVATQGDWTADDWVTDFKLSYSSDGNDWTPYKDANNTEVEFQRQGNSSTVDQHKLPVIVSTRYVRFHPTKRHDWNCMRVEVYGTADIQDVVVDHWLLNGADELVRFESSPHFIEGRCPGSKAVIFNQTNAFASIPIISLNDRSFTIAFWIKQTHWVLDEIGAIYSDWYDPWQFLISTRNQKITFHRHQHNDNDEWWSLESTNVTLDNWTHVAVTWDHVTGFVFIYADGKQIGYKSFTPGSKFYQPTGSRYQVGNDGHYDNHQFYGSVMDLYVFGTALSLDQINRLRGVPFLVNTAANVTGRIVVVAWEPPFDGACPIVGYTVYYREVMSLERKSKWLSVTVDRNSTSYTLHIDCGKDYDVAVTSRSEYKESALSDSKVWNFKTDGEYRGCYEVDWQITLSQPGWTNCSCGGSYLTGVWRHNDAVIPSEDGIDNIKRGRCCIPPQEYEDNTPVCQIVDWKTRLSRNNQWATCPEGYFLHGISLSSGTSLNDIEQALCCRPRNFQNTNMDCYIEGARESLDKRGWSKCWDDSYYMAGLYRGGCDNLYCVEMIKCCKMTPPGAHAGTSSADMVVLGHWLLNGTDDLVRFNSSPNFIEGRCPGSKAVIFNQANSFASTPIIDLNNRSFTIACWIKQTRVFDELGAIYGDWYYPWQFLLSTKNQKITFHRHKQDVNEEWWSLESTDVTMDNWTHLAVTWNNVNGSVFIYADGKQIGKGSFIRGSTFYQPTGSRYQVGNDGHYDDHQFHGSVMDLYVFGTALSLDQINRIRGSNNKEETNFVKSTESQAGNILSVPQLAGLLAGFGVLMIVGFIIILSLRRKSRRKRQLARNAGPRRSKSTIIPLRRWEVLPEQVVFKREIGCGAFGKVFKGNFKESPGIEVFYEPRAQTVDFKTGRTVAIKVLGDTTDGDARNQFLEEIELMKEIGSHQNVLRMLGCCVNSDPIFLVLEYVPYGDLLHWLRNKRIQVRFMKSYQRNYDNGENHLPLSTNEVHTSTDEDSKPILTGKDGGREHLAEPRKEKRESACSSTLVDEADTRKNSVLETEMEGTALNHHEQESTCTTENASHSNIQKGEEFSAKDLLSFAWQIARGMNFLSNNGFVHRDLAARNILLGEDKVVKISDFGLMRQTHDNVYQLKKGKKIPVKWMAPEALYNSEYTTKSDVWSFGILLWELSTMGGNPYPGINNKELYKLLKTGYRMEKPDTCSDKLYQLMLNCWKEDPSERPTFESVTKSLEDMMLEDTPYLDLETLDESKPYYCCEQLSDDDDVTV